MSSRFPPSSGFNSRDRSPPRFGDRRAPVGPRGPDDGSPSFDREPPRGPRALVDSPRGGFGGGRGRGYGRGDFRDRDRDRDMRDRDRDRDFRDNRDAPPFRRDLDRDWGRRDRNFDPRDAPRMGFGRGRSRSPTRDFRDLRDPPGRDFDLVRMRRNSRDSLLSASSGGPDGPPSSGGHPRGGSLRGRGRGDWEGGRGRGRPTYMDDREPPFRRRSRSREVWRDRGRDRLADRDRERELDRDRLLDRERERDLRERDRDRDQDRRERFDRRDDWDSRRPDRDDRERPIEPWKRERPPSRASSRGPISLIHPSNPNTMPLPSGPSTHDRLPDVPFLDQARKASIVPSPAGIETRRDSERSEPAPLRPEVPKDLEPISQHSPPPSAPQVPAFGSVSAPILPLSADKGPSEGRPIVESSPQIEKDRTDGPRRPSLQPPTGPKAERVERSPDPTFYSSDGGHQQDERSRAPHLSTHVSDRSPPTAPAAMVKRDSIPSHGETLRMTKPTSMNMSPTFARLPPPGPRASSRETSISPRMQSSTIPTGPRAYQPRPAASPRGPNKANKPWAHPISSRAPSVSNVPPKRDADEYNGLLPANDKPRQTQRASSPPREHKDETHKMATDDAEKPTSPISPSMKLPIRTSPAPVTVTTGEASKKGDSEEGENEDSAPIPGFGQSDEEEEENVVFNQEYLEERKQIFERDMQLLRAEMPPPPLEDPIIVSLLLRIQLLGMLAHEEELQPPLAPPPPSLSLPLPSVEQEETSNASGNERVVTFEPYLKPEQHEPEAHTEAAVPTTESDPQILIESLPFLNSGPPTPLSDLEVCRENVLIQERLRHTICSELSKKQKEIAKKNAVLRDEYMSYYKPWRLAIWELDRFKDKKPMTPGPASPPAPPAPVSPAPTQEGRESRRYKGNSELDFLNALRASEISAQEELERRRTKMATARPDLSREAVIPDMLEREEEIARIYKDVNNIVEARHALDVFGFIPPRNDFTEKEHEIFTNAFMAHPKKWGKIAESLPGRTFKQCIVHYYLTKEEIKYKAKLNKRWSRRGRGKQKSTRPKSNALIADLGVVKPDFDGEEEPAPVTDTGRPRRAAAPTFGDYNEPEGSATGRRSQTSKDGELIEKPASRRGGRTAGGTRGQRRGRTTQPDQKSQGPTPQSTTPVTVMPQTDISADGLVENIMAQDRELIEKELNPQMPRPKTVRGRAKEGMYVFDTTEAETIMPAKPMESGYGGMQPTSYWSVPEQRDFPRLLAHFGRDFEGISNFMKTKTTVMVKNYYQRRLDSGQKDFEETLLLAEEKKARGEPTGALPVPTSAPKRRYEATPSAIVPRPLAPHGELMTEAEEARFSSKGKPLAMSPQPMPLHGRPISDSERGPSRYPALAQASNTGQVPGAASTLGEDASRAMRTQPGAAHRIQGPRLGYFTEDRRDSIMGHSNPRAPDMQILSRQNPGAPISSDLARMDPLSAQGYMSTQPPPSLLPPSHSRHPSLTQAPGSPTSLARHELDFSSVHREPFSQRQYYQPPGQPVGLAQSPRPVLSPVKDAAPRPSVTPIPEPTSRQVPAKRSNIMSILNDEPEDPQPRKRVASEQTTSVPVSSSSLSRSAYQHAGPTRPDEALISGAGPKPSSYSQQSQYSAPSRYPEYSNYGPPPGGSGTSANNDWMARFDPRAQQAGPPSQSQAPPPSGRASTSMASQSSFSPYTSAPTQPSASLGNLSAPSPAPTPPATSQRSSYPNVFSQPTPAPSGPREMPSQSSVYRPSSPPSRASSVAFGSRQEQSTPVQSSASLFGLTPRQPASQSSYAPATSSTPALSQAHNQSYQQHVQTLVSGSHQSHRTTLAGGPPQYGHSTPPPQTQGGRSMPSLATLGRSYTPPAAMHPPGSGMGYAPPPPATSGPIPPLQRPSGQGSLGEPPSVPTHHRVYSQGSSQSGMPGPLHPASQPPR